MKTSWSQVLGCETVPRKRTPERDHHRVLALIERFEPLRDRVSAHPQTPHPVSVHGRSQPHTRTNTPKGLRPPPNLRPDRTQLPLPCPSQPPAAARLTETIRCKDLRLRRHLRHAGSKPARLDRTYPYQSRQTEYSSWSVPLSVTAIARGDGSARDRMVSRSSLAPKASNASTWSDSSEKPNRSVASHHDRVHIRVRAPCTTRGTGRPRDFVDEGKVRACVGDIHPCGSDARERPVDDVRHVPVGRPHVSAQRTRT